MEYIKQTYICQIRYIAYTLYRDVCQVSYLYRRLLAAAPTGHQTG